MKVLDLLSYLKALLFQMTLLKEVEAFSLLSPLEILLYWMTLLQEGEVFDLLSHLRRILFPNNSPTRVGGAQPPISWGSSLLDDSPPRGGDA
ncbi:UNVERIFIED_CONTAM: hypothetical protein Sangu_1168900 [Sesamum angustifolium]|uniref:Uncharacterized protein n=1 Tax=Sesamum angustifolium TaxID=2727405 RepID=A0AAW2P1N7_9LAMI